MTPKKYHSLFWVGLPILVGVLPSLVYLLFFSHSPLPPTRPLGHAEDAARHGVWSWYQHNTQVVSQGTVICTPLPRSWAHCTFSARLPGSPFVLDCDNHPYPYNDGCVWLNEPPSEQP